MPMPINMSSHLLSSASRQSAHADLLPKFYSPIPVSIAPYPYQSAFSTEQATQMGLLPGIRTPTSAYMGFPHLLSASSLPSIGGQNPMFMNTGLQVSTSKKRPAQRQAPAKLQNNVAVNQGPQQLSSTNKRQAQVGPPPKVQTELFESVRSKLRESLAASFAMAPDQQNKSELVDKSSPKEAESIAPQTEYGIGPVGLTSTAANPSICVDSPEKLTSSEQDIKNESQDVPNEAILNASMSDQTEPSGYNRQEDQATHATLQNEISINPFINDELLQGHGLCWASDIDAGNSETIVNQDSKRPKLSHEEITEGPKLLAKEVSNDSKEADIQNANSLATKIEAELFKLFGGVNKKYKEKARSLLFNLKDRSNPELRERVLSGDIAPDRLCSMTAEELASKELSQWRLAKAEEYAQMVVLPDSEVDIRRLVKKNHKGEFQVVEIEPDDSISVEVAVGESIFSRVPSKTGGAQTRSKSDEREARSMPNETKVSERSSIAEKGDDSGAHNDPRNSDTLLNEKADFMQDLIVDELKDTECLPSIVSLDEFMQDLDNEPPFDSLSADPSLSQKNSDNSVPEVDPESCSSEPKSEPGLDSLSSKLDPSEATSRSKSPAKDSEVFAAEGSKLFLPEDSKLTLPKGSELSPADAISKDPQEIVINNTNEVDAISMPDNDVKSSSAHAESSIYPPDFKPRSDNIWEGLLQLNISALSTVIGFFRSGERTSTQDWPSFLEIKGRVRLDPFEKFLQELHHSRSRAIMIVHFCWKEGSHDSGRLNVIETANSYIADQRVGFAEPASGVELYFCPPHPKTIEMLESHLPKELTAPLSTTINGLIGVVVWKRPHVTTISPRPSSHHKHGSSSKKQSSSRRQHQNNSFPSSRASAYPKPPLLDDEPIDDVPPGFGPPSARDEDDLPEFDFYSNSSQQKPHNPPASAMLPPAPVRPVEQMRELIQRYGKGGNNNDDVPEWQPRQNNQQLPPLPSPPPPPPPQAYNNFQQQPMQQQPQQQPFMMQQFAQMGVPFPMPMQQPQQQQIHPQMGFINPGWQQGGPSWPPTAQGQNPSEFAVNYPIMQQCHMNFSGQPASNSQFYGAPAFVAVPQQNGMMGWRPDVPRNSGV